METPTIKAPSQINSNSGKELYRQIKHLELHKKDKIIIDLSQTDSIDTYGCAWILHIAEELKKKHCTLIWTGEKEKVKEILEIVSPAFEYKPLKTRTTSGVFDIIFDKYSIIFSEIKDFINLCIDAIYWTILAPLLGKKFRWELFIEEVYEMGVRAVRIVCLMNFLLGLIIAMLSAAQVASFGLSIYVANLIMIGFARELAAIMTATVVSARTGAAISAEISTMKVQEEIDALRGMGINVVQYLVAPKMLALLIVLPCLSVLGLIFGLLGGSAWGIVVLGFNPAVWFRQTINSAQFNDLLQGLLKTFVFAVFIVLIGCHNGFRVVGGSRGVGLMTTRAVVMDVFMLIAVDIVFAVIFYYLI
ncbi:MAG TPA: ABC transporter permease [Candidatus Hydrogenedens sp.]|nr:ABC transporter permease [Candidatus Hydrogenedens sp.]HOL19974.1 ABC transporter permease [Candidatus Hydrogenedens sp.]HPP59601.1 ABC transporter permease [Candidatus Hydrogenedens sp.]